MDCDCLLYSHIKIYSPSYRILIQKQYIIHYCVLLRTIRSIWQKSQIIMYTALDNLLTLWLDLWDNENEDKKILISKYTHTGCIYDFSENTGAGKNHNIWISWWDTTLIWLQCFERWPLPVSQTQPLSNIYCQSILYRTSSEGFYSSDLLLSISISSVSIISLYDRWKVLSNVYPKWEISPIFADFVFKA